MSEQIISILEERFALGAFEILILKIWTVVVEIVLTLLIAAIFVRIIKYLTNRFIKSSNKNSNGLIGLNTIAGASERKINTLRFIVYTVLKYVIYFLAVCNILDKIGISVQAVLAVAGIGSVAIGFGSQSLVKDIITGLFVLLEDQLFVGDAIDIGGKSGIVEKIGLRTTCIRGTDGSLFIIPNSEIKIVTNMSKDFRRIVLEVTLEKTGNMELLKKQLDNCLKSFAEKEDELLSEPFIQGISKIADNNITYKIICECESRLYDKINMEIKSSIKDYCDKNELKLKSI